MRSHFLFRFLLLIGARTSAHRPCAACQEHVRVSAFTQSVEMVDAFLLHRLVCVNGGIGSSPEIAVIIYTRRFRGGTRRGEAGRSQMQNLQLDWSVEQSARPTLLSAQVNECGQGQRTALS